MRRFAWPFLAAASLIAVARADAATRPRYGGVLRVEMHAAPKALDPADNKLGPLVFDRLVTLDDSGRPRPSLAASWQHDAEQKQWQLRLRTRVKFHDGSALDPASVAEAAGGSASGDTIVIRSERPAPGLLYELAAGRGVVSRRTADGTIVGTGPFRLTRWEPGRRAVLAANEDYWGGRPFVDSVEIEMGRALREQVLDLELGRADVAEIAATEARRAAQRGTTIAASDPVDLVALEFQEGRGAEDPRLREAVALSVDRAAIHGVLYQRQGDVARGLLPQWLSGYAYLFSAAPNLERARQLAAGVRAGPLTLAYDASDPAARAVAERIAVNLREVKITVRVAQEPASGADLRLSRRRIWSVEPLKALAELAADLGLSDANPQTAEHAYELERGVLESFRVVPLVHLPEIYGLSPRVKNWPERRAGGWALGQVWVDGPQP